jgi:hypothetical protein
MCWAAALAVEFVVVMFGECDAVVVLVQTGGEVGSGAIGLATVVDFWCG